MTGPREHVTFRLGSAAVGDGKRCLVVGEIGQGHDGSLGLAHAYIDAIAKAGADAVKFQTHIASAESTLQEPFRVRFSTQDASRYDYWKRMEFTESQWGELAHHAREKELLFLSSPFSLEAVDVLARVGVPAWKLASGEITNSPLLERMLDTGLPLLLSTGMSPLAEIDRVVDVIRGHQRPFLVLQCTSLYPCPPERVGLNLLPLLHARYRCPVGLSDHSGTIYPGLAAAVLGAEMLEVHVTMSREMFGPDVPSSVTLAELRQLVDGVRMIERMRAHPVDKDAMAQELAPMRELFCKSLVARTDLPAGTVVRESHLAMKKPGTGMAPARVQEVVGRRLRRAVAADEMLHEHDFGEP